MNKQEAAQQAIYNGHHQDDEMKAEILRLISLPEYNHNYRIGEKSRLNGDDCRCVICKESL